MHSEADGRQVVAMRRTRAATATLQRHDGRDYLLWTIVDPEVGVRRVSFGPLLQMTLTGAITDLVAPWMP